jgi:UDP-N-acetylglucosamine--N-acetylmuramyl-(pentapeptide) pyrophosphoryl-undecaprenol N-acetylglucosamine transferase
VAKPSTSTSPYRAPSQPPTLFLCGGGTGGHVYPALAVAEVLATSGRADKNDQRRTTNDESVPSVIEGGTSQRGQLSSSVFRPPSVVYVGSEDGMERGLVQAESDLPFCAIPAAAVRGRGPLALARNMATIARGTRAAQQLIAARRPAAILGTGGYVCVPLFLAARAARVPTIIYLPDVAPGLAVRLLARLATAVACNVEDSASYLRKGIDDLRLFDVKSGRVRRRVGAQRSATNQKLVVVGYPVRPELFDLDRGACRAAFGLDERAPVVLIYGGSRGARSINRAIATLLEPLLGLAQVIHICGREGDEQFLREAAARLPEGLRERYRLYSYLYSGAGSGVRNQETVTVPLAPSMVAAFGAADLAVCRSGASTLAELPAAGLPALLVPYPYVHQDENADYLVQRGAAVKVADADLLGSLPSDGPLFRNIRRLIIDNEERALMAKCSKALARPDAARRLADMLLDLAARRGPA